MSNVEGVDASAHTGKRRALVAVRADAGELSVAGVWTLTLVATMTMAVSHVDRQALAVLAPTITRALGMSDTAYGVLSSGFALAYLVFAPFGGRFIDRFGARRGLLASVVAWSAVAAAHALVPGMWTLFVLRLLLGLTEAPSFPAAAQTVSRVLAPSDRSMGFGILFSGSSFGSMLAPLLATWMEARWGWRLALLGTAVVGLSWVPLWLAVTNRREARRLLAPMPPKVDAARDATFRWRSVVGHGEVIRAMVAIVATAPLTAFAITWASKILVARYGLVQAEVGRYLWLPPVAFDLGGVGIGALATWRERRLAAQGDTQGARGRRRALLGASALLACAVASLGFSRSPWGATLVLGASLVGSGGIYALATADVLRRVPRAWIPVAGGLIASAQSLAHVVANPVIGAVRDRTHSYSGIAVALGAWVLPGALVWIAWSGKNGRSQRDGE